MLPYFCSIIARVTYDPYELYVSSVGFSGVLFTYAGKYARTHYCTVVQYLLFLINFIGINYQVNDIFVSWPSSVYCQCNISQYVFWVFIFYFMSRVFFPFLFLFYIIYFSVIEANHTAEVTRSVFGLFNVPSRLLPYVLLVLLQVLTFHFFNEIMFKQFR